MGAFYGTSRLATNKLCMAGNRVAVRHAPVTSLQVWAAAYGPVRCMYSAFFRSGKFLDDTLQKGATCYMRGIKTAVWNIGL